MGNPRTQIGSNVTYRDFTCIKCGKTEMGNFTRHKKVCFDCKLIRIRNQNKKKINAISK